MTETEISIVVLSNCRKQTHPRLHTLIGDGLKQGDWSQVFTVTDFTSFR